MGLGPCCVDLRKCKKKSTNTIITEYQGRLDNQEVNHQTSLLQESVWRSAFEKELTENSKAIPHGNWRELPINANYLFCSIPTCPESGNFADGLQCYPLGYEPIMRNVEVRLKWMTEEDVRLDQIRKERNKLLARTSSEMVNDVAAKGIIFRSSSAQLTERPQSPDE